MRQVTTSGRQINITGCMHVQNWAGRGVRMRGLRALHWGPGLAAACTRRHSSLCTLQCERMQLSLQ